MLRRSFLALPLALAGCRDEMAWYTKGGLIVVSGSGQIQDDGTGSLSNGDSVILSGGPFGTKSGSSPTLDDHGQDGNGNINAGWSGTWPNDAVTTAGNLKNRTAPFQTLGSSTINGPHPYTNTFLAGNHTGDASRSSDVMAFLSYAPPAQPWYSYWRWRWRFDPNWYFAVGAEQQSFTGTLTSGSPTITNVSSFTNIAIGGTLEGTGIAHPDTTNITAFDTNANTITMNENASGAASGSPSTITVLYTNRDNNTKEWDFSNDIHPFATPDNWYNALFSIVSTGSGSTLAKFWVPNSNSDTRANMSLNDDNGFNQAGGALSDPDQNGHSHNWNACANGANTAMGETGTGGWITSEIVAKWTTATSGYWRYYENGVLIVNYAGPTVYTSLSGTISEAIGGFARNVGGVPSDTVNYHSPASVGALTQWRYFADNICDRQTTGLGRFILTNSSTYTLGDGNIAEYCPYTAYANGQVTITIRKGNLHSGTARIWFVDEANGISTPALQKTITLS